MHSMSGTAGEKRVKEQRVTKQRLAVETAMRGLDDFVSAQELHRLLQDRGEKVSLATVYRIVQSMSEDGLLDVVRTTEGEAAYRHCEAEHHHHHLVCRVCGKGVEVEAPAVESWAAQVAAENGFTDATHTVEIHGLCPACTAASSA